MSVKFEVFDRHVFTIYLEPRIVMKYKEGGRVIVGDAIKNTFAGTHTERAMNYVLDAIKELDRVNKEEIKLPYGKIFPFELDEKQKYELNKFIEDYQASEAPFTVKCKRPVTRHVSR